MSKKFITSKKVVTMGLTALMCLGSTASFWDLPTQELDQIALNPFSVTVYAATLPQFKDEIPDWASSDISYLVDKGIMKGYEDGTFRANGTMTRLEFLTAVVRSLKTDAEIESLIAEGKKDHPDSDGATYNPYKEFIRDLNNTNKNFGINQKAEDFWGTPYLFVAQELGISTGITTLASDKAFTGDGAYMTNITREEACQIMYNACTKVKGESLPELKGIQNIINTGTDGIDIYFDTAVKNCVSNGLIAGIDDNYTIAAKQTLTRAQACAIIARITDQSRRLAKPVVPEDKQEYNQILAKESSISFKNPVTNEIQSFNGAMETIKFQENTYPNYNGSKTGEYSSNGWWKWDDDCWIFAGIEN